MPGAAAGLRVDDEIVSIDGRRTPGLTIDEARALFRAAGHRALEIRRGERVLRVRLETRRMV
jgi:C-terminal processing protease CtpA/Prc